MRLREVLGYLVYNLVTALSSCLEMAVFFWFYAPDLLFVLRIEPFSMSFHSNFPI